MHFRQRPACSHCSARGRAAAGRRAGHPLLLRASRWRPAPPPPACSRDAQGRCLCRGGGRQSAPAAVLPLRNATPATCRRTLTHSPAALGDHVGQHSAHLLRSSVQFLQGLVQGASGSSSSGWCGPASQARRVSPSGSSGCPLASTRAPAAAHQPAGSPKPRHRCRIHTRSGLPWECPLSQRRRRGGPGETPTSAYLPLPFGGAAIAPPTLLRASSHLPAAARRWPPPGPA